MAKFKKGDRVEVIDQKGDPRARIGDKGTVVGINHLDDEATLRVVTDKGKQIEMFEWRFKLITTTMNDNDKVETTVANIKAAHAKGCSDVKKVLETLYPKVFEKPLKVGDKFMTCGATYILCQVDGYYALINIETGSSYNNRGALLISEAFCGHYDRFTRL